MAHSPEPVIIPLAWMAVLAVTCTPELGVVRQSVAEVRHAEKKSLDSGLGSGSVRVMSWNVQGNASRIDPKHIQAVAEVIRELSPDIVLLQEIHRNTRASGGLDQFVILVDGLGLSGCFGESLRAGPEGRYGNAILTTGTVGSARIFVLPGRGEPRTVLECVSRWGDLEIPLLTTHLTAWDRANRRKRTIQVHTIEELLDRQISPLVMIGGDFNASINSPEMQRLAGNERMQAVIEEYVVTHRGTGRQYDHLFVGDGWTIESARVVRRGPSDHWPILAMVRFEGERHD